MCSEHRINLLPLPSSRGHYGSRSDDDGADKSAREKMMIASHGKPFFRLPTPRESLGVHNYVDRGSS